MNNRDDFSKQEIDAYIYYQQIIKGIDFNSKEFREKYAKINGIKENELEKDAKLMPMKFSMPNEFYDRFKEYLKYIDFSRIDMEAFACGAKMHFASFLINAQLDQEKTIVAREAKQFFLNPLDGLNKILDKKVKFDVDKFNDYDKQQEKRYFGLETNASIERRVTYKEDYKTNNTKVNNIIDENKVDNEHLPDLAIHLAETREKYSKLPWYKRLFGNKEAKEYKNTIDKTKNAMIKFGLSKSDVNKITTKNNCKHNLEIAVYNKEIKELNDYKKKIDSLKDKKNRDKYINETFIKKKTTNKQFKEAFDMLKDIYHILEKTKNIVMLLKLLIYFMMLKKVLVN